METSKLVDELLDELEGMIEECRCSDCRSFLSHIGSLDTKRAREAIEKFVSKLNIGSHAPDRG